MSKSVLIALGCLLGGVLALFALVAVAAWFLEGSAATGQGASATVQSLGSGRQVPKAERPEEGEPAGKSAAGTAGQISPGPSAADTPLAQGIAAYKAGDDEGLSRWLKVLESDPKQIGETQLLRAMQLVRQQKVDQALELLHAAAGQASIRGHALGLAGELLFRKQDFRTAEQVLKAALVADPGQVDPHRWLAAWYYDLGAMDDALWHLEQVAKLDPKDARPWRMRGIILGDFERHAEAIAAYKNALARDLSAHVIQEVHAELAASLLAIRNPSEALEHLVKCGSSAETESLRADCHFSLGDLAAAESALGQALQFDPDHAKALMLKSTVAREQGQIELAAETLAHAVQAHPYEFDFRFHYMSVLNALGKKEQAVVQQAEMKRLRALRDRFTQLHHESMQDPNSADLRFQLGQTAEQLGKTEMARSWYQAALAIDGNYTQAGQALRGLAEKSVDGSP